MIWNGVWGIFCAILNKVWSELGFGNFPSLVKFLGELGQIMTEYDDQGPISPILVDVTAGDVRCRLGTLF